jgi:ketosteroid isomerase-like protein
MSIMPKETVILGDMAWSMGTYTIDYTTADGPAQIDGKFLTLLRRQDDGSWGIYRDIFNLNTQ